MTLTIEGKVAQVTSDRELIINRGEQDGVTEGMTFRVKGQPISVVDPDTKEEIGTIAKVKVVVRVVEVAERFCIARTFRSRKINVGGDHPGLGISGMFQPPKWETRVETLRRDPSADTEISATESIVSVGDLVELADPDDLEAEATTIWR
ncbi:hypothetical protein AB0878_48890 [Amycolatopsis sp. NPDC047767]|uniref:hypothetical protein n=1 Tax=Amycolatopsis sp. NPDC047767 TaxID=3156765 RepID=UPI003455F30C